MARTLYVASTNPGKLRDFALAAAGHGMLILPLPGLDAIEPPAEDGLTFEDNAREKAIYYSRFLPGEIVLADDSGLEVDILQGAPGVRSARYAADAGFRAAATTDVNNNLFLLQQLAGVPDSERGARYHCVLAAAQDGDRSADRAGHRRGPHPLRSAGQRRFRIRSALLSACPRTHHGGDGRPEPSGRLAIADRLFAPYCNSWPNCHLPNRTSLRAQTLTVLLSRTNNRELGQIQFRHLLRHRKEIK